MKVCTVGFKSYNRRDYCETVSGRNEQETYQNAQRAKKDSRDAVKWIEEDETKGLGGYPWYNQTKGDDKDVNKNQSK